MRQTTLNQTNHVKDSLLPPLTQTNKRSGKDINVYRKLTSLSPNKLRNPNVVLRLKIANHQHGRLGLRLVNVVVVGDNVRGQIGGAGLGIRRHIARDGLIWVEDRDGGLHLCYVWLRNASYQWCDVPLLVEEAKLYRETCCRFVRRFRGELAFRG